MTIEQAIKNFKKLKTDLPKRINVIAEFHAGKNLVSEIKSRVIETGIGKRGKFSGYSTRAIYINTSVDSPKKLKPTGKTGKSVFANGKPHKTTYFGDGYKQFRGDIGRQNSFKNFYLTGEMWRGFDVKSTKSTRDNIQVTLGAKNTASRKKIEENSEREGVNITAPTKQEVSIVAEVLEKDIIKLISNGIRNR